MARFGSTRTYVELSDSGPCQTTDCTNRRAYHRAASADEPGGGIFLINLLGSAVELAEVVGSSWKEPVISISLTGIQAAASLRLCVL